MSARDAARFLAQASFGPTSAEIERTAAMGYGAWLDEQFARPVVSHRAFVQSIASSGTTVNATHFRQSFWRQAITGE